jgi:ABC-2 type transport system ATP-binding protein
VEALSQVPGVKDVSVESNGDYSVFNLRLDANADPSDAVMRLASDRKWSIRELVRKRATLEDVFVDLTHSDS